MAPTGSGNEKARIRRARRRWLAQTLVGLLALPLTVVPFWLYSSRTDPGYLIYLNARYSVHAPPTPPLDPAAKRRAAAHGRIPFRGVPVLVYHGIGRVPADEADRRFVVSRRHFGEQMMSLREAGYRAVTPGQLARYLRTRDRRALPRRPILITFDDGRVDALLQGDPVLRDSGMKATMFAIGRASQSDSPYYAGWGDLARYARSGRWQLGNHTFDLHHQIHRAAVPMSALVTPNRFESAANYTTRLSSDLRRNDRLLARHGGGAREAFAYPFGDWGERSTPAARSALHRVLAARFAVAFDQDEQETWRPALPGDDRLHVHRLSVEDWTAAQFLARLERGYRQPAA